MKKEPLILYLLRFVFSLLLFALMAMLYWSSLLVEEDLKSIHEDLRNIKKELQSINEKKEIFSQYAVPLSKRIKEQEEVSLSSDSNLLTPDLFYTTTLPKLLGPNFKPSGIRRLATIGKPNNLNPFNAFHEIASWNRLCVGSLVAQHFGIYETYAPSLATSMELRHENEEYPEYWFRLRKDVYWEPINPQWLSNNVELASQFQERHQVTAHDFKFYYDVVMNPHIEAPLAITTRAYFEGIEEIKVIDDFTLCIRWKAKKVVDEKGQEKYQLKYMSKEISGGLSPLPRFVYQYFADGTKILEEDSDENTYRTNSIWAQNFPHHWAQNIIVSCGAWIFDGLSDREIKFKRNPNYYDPLEALTEAIEYKFTDSIDAFWNDFKIGQIDSLTLQPSQLSELDLFMKSDIYQKQLKEGKGISKLNFLARQYWYVAWNELRPFFNSKKVRQALTMAINRERIIRQTLYGMGIQTTGTFFPLSPSYDKSIKPYPFDKDRARQLLYEEGWSDSSGTGVLEKVIDGKMTPFRFYLTYFIKNPETKAICEFVSTSLREIGIDCILRGVDVADLSAAVENRDFDALSMAWTLGTPPEDPKQLWYSPSKNERGSSNFIHFSNKEVDEIIEKLEYENNQEKRIDLYHRFSKIIYDEAPYVFLFTPKSNFVYRDYLQNVFIPADRQDLIPGANVGDPQSTIFSIKNVND